MMINRSHFGFRFSFKSLNICNHFDRLSDRSPQTIILNNCFERLSDGISLKCFINSRFDKLSDRTSRTVYSFIAKNIIV